MITSRILTIALVGVCALVGCVGPQIQPNAGTIAQIKNIYIVPMEPPPLSLDSTYVATGSSSMVHFLPRYTIGMARTAGVLSGVALLLDLPEMSQRQLVYPPSVQAQVSPVETWHFSAELAQKAMHLVTAAGKLPTVSLEMQPVPGIQERERTVLMENWMAPIRAWYNDTSPSSRYAALTAKGVGAVAEVGISNYSIFSGKLLLQVHVKLIDPTSGRLLGRARASSYTELPSMDEAFSADAKVFKESALRAGTDLLSTCLRELSVLAPTEN